MKGKKMLYFEEIYQKNLMVVTRKIAGITILVPMKMIANEKNIFVFNDMASFIWELTDGKSTLRTIGLNLFENFDAPIERIYDDLNNFVLQAKKINAISIVCMQSENYKEDR
jgi:hypothetical protein